MYDAGHAYEFGEYNKPIDKKEACNWYRRAANQGFTVAQHRLEQLENSIKSETNVVLKSQHTSGVSQNANEESEQIFRKAWRHEHGDGVDEDKDYAIFLYQKAAKMGNEMAKARIEFLQSNM